ncbi:Werner Syndrome-like exonuclease isoform X2 [Rhodamnia argentea]|uniref:Werner Syndrome-like exonuclease isoform X2 n=1 Tax=Rhodamnia argentea TaxID=178133 RepID=A0A8B8NU68_9MYRT|nr:Werner Syndrome-like exonuclease isoform X2 [Rhodamnia argentea]
MTISIVDHELPDDTHNLYDVIFYGLSVRTLLTYSPPIASSWLSSRGSQPLLVGFDIEWRPNFSRNVDNRVAILQLSVGLHCLIFQLLQAPEIPPPLADFLRDPSHVFVGIGIDEDVEKLLCDHGLGVANAVDLRDLAARELGREELRRAGLKTLAKEVLGREIDKPKRVTTSRWDNPWLTSVQVQYACLDAFVSLQIGEALNAGGARPGGPGDGGRLGCCLSALLVLIPLDTDMVLRWCLLIIVLSLICVSNTMYKHGSGGAVGAFDSNSLCELNRNMQEE